MDRDETAWRGVVRWWRDAERRQKEREEEQKEWWERLPADKKGVFMICGGCAAMPVALLVPFISFDATYASHVLDASWRPPNLPVYPMGRSISLADWLDYPVLTVMQAALCAVFAVRFASQRTAPPYWLMWICAVLCAFDAVTALFAFWPGYVGYNLWGGAEYGYLWVADNTQAAMSNGMFDFWKKVDKVHSLIAAYIAAVAVLFLGGAWQLRKVRVADKAALDEHRMRILNENQGDTNSGPPAE